MGNKSSNQNNASDTTEASPAENDNVIHLAHEDVEAMMVASGRSEQEIRAAFEEFKQEHPNGKLNLEDFKTCLKEAMPKKYVESMAEHIYRIYDTDGDGTIDFKEFMIVFYIMSEGSEEDVLGGIFRVFDIDGNGSICLDEMKKLVNSMYRLLKKDDPNLESQKFIADSAFSEADDDKDGLITKEEFIKACLAQESFVNLLTLKLVDIFV